MSCSRITQRHKRSRRIGWLAGFLGRILDRVPEFVCRKVPEGLSLFSIRYPLGNIFLLEVRNFLGRIELLYTKFLWEGVYLGPCYAKSETGHLVLNTATGDSTDYIEQLTATFPWATAVDCQIFVETQNARSKTLRVSEGSDLPCNEESIHSSQCPCQFTNSFNSQTLSETPAAIAGVTRKVE
jgi:hypothetical protein